MTVYRYSIFEIQQEKLGRYLFLSIITHLFLAVTFFYLPDYLDPSLDPWGNNYSNEGSIAVGLVQQSMLRGLNLPRPKQTTKSTVATESTGLGQTEEAKPARLKTEAPEPNAFEVKSKKKAKAKKRKPVAKKKTPRQIAKVDPSPKRIPFGEGGAPELSYSQFKTGTGSGGIGVGEGFFGKKYGWYVRQIRDIVSNNWQKNLVSPNLRTAERVIIQFDIYRDGSIKNEFVRESSGIPSLDRSGIRAIKASRFPPLPGGETLLTAEFWFEHSR